VTPKRSKESSWLAVAGRWSFQGRTATYLGPDRDDLPHGIALSSHRARKGHATVSVALSEIKGTAGRILFGYDSRSQAYFTAGLGGHGMAYLLDEYIPGRRWQALRGHAAAESLTPEKPASIRVDLTGQRMSLSIDDIKLISENLPHPLLGDQIGLFAWGQSQVTFSNLQVSAGKPQAFVVMQFGEPYDSFHQEVIVPIAKRLGLEAVRGDDIYGPGIILNDIIRHIEQADVVIAEITPVNANVFYELGYAHALQKQVILLAEASVQLPFDLTGYRCILYKDSIAGKTDVEDALEKHLRSVLASWGYIV
jgi:hypothetical protein